MVSKNKNSKKIKSETQGMRLIDSLLRLKMILKKMEKISVVKDLEINNKLKKLETEKIDELELLQESLRLATLRNIFRGRPNRIEEEIELRKQTRKIQII